MKKIFTIALLLSIHAMVSAQEVGRAGSLIKNEATNAEMKTANRNISSTTNDRTNTSNNRPNGNRVEGRAPSYQWNYSNGTSEVFLRIPERGYYTVQLDDQTISSSTGRYRFYDVRSGRNVLSIYRNGYLVYKAPLQVQNNMRTILDFFEGYGLYLLDNYSLRNQNYGFNQWDDVWNNFYNGNYNSSQNSVMNRSEFDSFMKSLNKNSSFDEDVISFVRQQMRSTFFTSDQIKAIISKMSFDKNKVILAKEMYHSCTDPNNFYIVYDSFTFRQYRNEVMDYVSRLNR